MKIIILGAGQVGGSTAEILSREQNDITLVDKNPKVLEGLQDRLDIRTVVGDAASPLVLENAGAEDAQMLLAVTESDEVNMVACQIGQKLFKIETKIARVRSPDYLRYRDTLFREHENGSERAASKNADRGESEQTREKQLRDTFAVDRIISPESVVSAQILRLIEYPGALQVIDFAQGKIRLVGVRAFRSGALVGQELRELGRHLPTVRTRVAAIYRGGRAIIPSGETVIERNDEVFFIATKDDIRKVMQELRRIEEVGERIIIAGAGNIGLRLARALEQTGFHVKLIERNPERAERVSAQLEDTVVLRGDAADEELLLQENIESMELFCALTNEDESNILSAMLAKRLGARRVMALVNRGAYIDLFQSSVLDIAVSPRLATVSALLNHVRRGDVQAAHSLRRGGAEVIEGVAHGDRKTSLIAERTLAEIELPEGASIVAIMRDDTLLPIRSDTIIQAEDHVVVFVSEKRSIPKVEKLFAVSAGYL